MEDTKSDLNPIPIGEQLAKPNLNLTSLEFLIVDTGMLTAVAKCAQEYAMILEDNNILLHLRG